MFWEKSWMYLKLTNFLLKIKIFRNWNSIIIKKLRYNFKNEQKQNYDKLIKYL